MPHILDVQFPEVQPSGAPSGDFERITTTPRMFGAFGGEAAEKLGGGVAKAAEAGLDYLTETNKLNNSIHAASLNSWFANQAGDKWTDFSQLKGRQALAARPKFLADLEDLRQQAMAQAPSLQEKALVVQSIRNIGDAYSRYSANHATSEANTYAKDTAGDAIATYANQASIAYMNGDRGGFETNLRNQDQEVRNFATHNGLTDPRDIEAEVMKRRGVTLRQIFETQADIDPNAAAADFSRYSNQMDPASRLAVMNKLLPMQKQQSYEIGGAVSLGRAPPVGAFMYGEKMAGLPPGYVSRVIQLESGGNPNAASPTGTYRGLGQFGPAEMIKYGITDPGDVVQVSSALLTEAEHNRPALAASLGRAPSASELYLAHQQGLGGASALLNYKNPDQPAWQAIRKFYGSDQIAQQAIWGNMTPTMKAQFPEGVTSVTAGEFSNLWRDRYMRGGEAANIIDKAEAYKRSDELFSSNPTMWRGVRGVIDREYNFQQTVTAQRRGELDAQVPSIIANVRNGNLEQPLPSDLALLGGEKTARIQAEYDSAYREGQARRTMVWASPEEIGSLYTNLATGPGSEEFRRQDLQAFDKAVNERNEIIFGSKNPDAPNAKKADPGGYVQAYPGVAMLRAKLDPKEPATFDIYATASLSLQNHLGVPQEQQHLLSRHEAEAYTTAITTPGADAKGILDTLQRQYGTHYSDVLRDMTTMGKLNPSYQLLGSLDPKDSTALGRWLQGIGPNEKGETKTADEILGEAAGKPVAVSIRTKVRSNEALTDLQHSWADSGFSVEQIRGLSGAVEDLAYAKKLYERMKPDDAADAAVAAVAGKYTILTGEGSARVPVEQYDTVRANAAKILNDAELAVPQQYFRRARPGELPGPGLGEASAEDYKRLVKDMPYWVTSPDGKGLNLKDSYAVGGLGKLVRANDGKPIFVPFNAPLMEGAKEALTATLNPAELPGAQGRMLEAVQ